MNDMWAQAESERMAANFIRIGRVTAVALKHEDGPRATVYMAGLDSDWLPWTVGRAGDVRTASAPSVGEQRLIFCPYGDTTQAVIGPAINQDDFPSPAETVAQHVALFPDGTRVAYDVDTGTLAIDVKGAGNVVVNCQQATVKAAGAVTLDTPTTHCTGALTVDGNATFKGGSVTHGGVNIGKDHKHGKVQAGAAFSDVPS